MWFNWAWAISTWLDQAPTTPALYAGSGSGCDHPVCQTEHMDQIHARDKPGTTSQALRQKGWAPLVYANRLCKTMNKKR